MDDFPFAPEQFGVLISETAGKIIIPSIEKIAAGTPIAAIFRTRAGSPKSAEAVNASASAVVAWDPARSEYRLSAHVKPLPWTQELPHLFFSEPDEWRVGALVLVVAWSLYCKEFYRETVEILHAATGPEERFLRALARLRLGEAREADSDLESVAMSWDRRIYRDQWARVAHARALASLEMGDYAGAVARSEGLVDIRPAHEDSIGRAYTANNLAIAWSKLGDVSKALDFLNGAVAALDRKTTQAAKLCVLQNLRFVEQSAPMAIREIKDEVNDARRQIQHLIGAPTKLFVRPGLRIVQRLRQATSISGDFFGIIPRLDGSAGVYLVDVEGHGLAAASTAVAVGNAIQRPTLNWGIGDPRDELRAADRIVESEFGYADIAVCMNFAAISADRKWITYANAGMPAPMLFNYGEFEPETLKAQGMYVGSGYSRTKVPLSQQHASVTEGDVLLMFTDGIPEALNARGRLFGQQGIIAAVSRAGLDDPQAIADEILEAVRLHSGKDQPDDDQAIIVIQIGTASPGALEQRGTPILAAIESSPISRAYELVNAADAMRDVNLHLKSDLIEWTAAFFPSIERRREIWNAIWEAIQNAIKYGSARGDVIRIEMLRQEDELEVVVAQPRRWPDWDREFGGLRRRHTLDEHGGVGTQIILNMANHVILGDQGRRLRMRFAANPPNADNKSTQ